MGRSRPARSSLAKLPVCARFGALHAQAVRTDRERLRRGLVLRRDRQHDQGAGRLRLAHHVAGQAGRR